MDDNLINQKVIQGFLTEYQLQITCVSSGYEALDCIRTGEEFDIIFMDHMMPIMDGVETTEKIRKMDIPSAKQIPIVALTANAISGVKEMFLASGMNDFLAKPIDVKLLDEILERWLPTEHLADIKEDYEPLPPEPEKQEVSSVPGMDYEAALEYFGGSQDILIEVLEVFCQESHDRIKELERLLHQKDYKNYIIEAHGLKSAAKSIMANELSEHAKEHEFAGKEGKYEWIDEHGGELINEYREFLASLENYMQGENSEDIENEAFSTEKEMFSTEKEEFSIEKEKFSALEMLETEDDIQKGTMQVGLEEFRLMYQYLAQLVKRNQQTLHVLTLEITNVSEGQREKAMDALGKAVCSALRESDICTQYDDNKYMVLLLGAQEGNGAFIAGRVLGAFDNLYEEGGCTVDYHIQQVNGG